QLAGALARDPLLSGDIAIDRAEILVPDSFGGGPADINVVHEDPPPGVASTLRRARADDGTPVPTGRPSVLRLAINVEAPARIFVRGRGLDAELGGSVRITGPITSVQPVGGFRLIRGRLAILAQRITFDEGTVTLIGDLDPFLDFVARSERSDITVLITVKAACRTSRSTFPPSRNCRRTRCLRDSFSTGAWKNCHRCSSHNLPRRQPSLPEAAMVRFWADSAMRSVWTNSIS